jgi:23S rRNA (guanosine2251-2'-O)-methyltransferase
MSFNRKPGQDRAKRRAKPAPTESRERRADAGHKNRNRATHEKPRKSDKGREPAPRPDADGRPERRWIYGRHAALAAIANPNRTIKRILATQSALEWIEAARLHPERLTLLTKVETDALDRALHEGAAHQGIAVSVEDLPRARLKEACEPDSAGSPVVVLDQITDPHNIGAIFRSAAAFGARAVIVQDRRTPPLAGALAKAAAGAVETVPCVPVVNIARALEGLKTLGYFCAGLSGDAPASISAIPADRLVALVFGAEGAGLRHLVRSTCDGVYAIAIARGVDSLNVSNAAAVSLYELARARSPDRP